MSRVSGARPAAAEDYDEDRDVEVSGTRVEARRDRGAVVRQPYPPTRTTSQAGPSRPRSSSVEPRASRVIIEKGRSESRSRHAPDATSRSAYEQDPERRYTLPHRPALHPIQPSTGYGGPVQPQATEPGAIPRVRTASYSGQRPVSWAAAPPHYAPAPSPTRGPPPSRSAYAQYGMYSAYPYVPAPAPPPLAYPPAPPPQHMPAYTGQAYPPSPSIYGPPSSVYNPSAPDPFPSYNPTPPSRPLAVQPPRNDMFNPRLEDPINRPSTVQPDSSFRRLRRSTNGRSDRPRHGHVPGSFEDASVFDDEDFYDSDEEYNYRARPARPASTVGSMAPPPRPQARIQAPLPPVPRAYPDLNTNPREISADMPRPSGHLRRQSSTRSNHSHRHSLSEAASDRTPATTVSNNSRRGVWVEVEDQRGRRKKYVPMEDIRRLKLYEAQAGQRSSTNQRVSDAEEYQARVRGGESYELSAENIMQMIDGVPSAPPSRHSQRSRRSTRSGTQTEGMRIKVGETILHLRGGSGQHTIDYDQDGTPVISLSDRRESTYYAETSRSSKSGAGRPRGDSEREGRRRSYVPDVREI